ncbi:esterase family protein [Anaerobacillus alkaliphilus]|uniref:Esterase family protein n=1 Tax=Anaerobacillus alkaliphilus TaxID=1548597 RepID=A0A4Q0VX32_9BACI|nr:alpha/beta hydrolase-fold protein [Anaerobacillus alkaliphilus]RXJ02185.1 esterase family protein [Anaerobacillus alkaliphilus]
METKRLWSEWLKREQRYELYQSGDQQEVDLLFVQDGDDYLQLGGIGELLQEYETAKRALAIILVPPGRSQERYDYYHPNGNQHEAYLSFFYQELLPEVEKNFSAQGKRIQKRGLLGDSLGGAVNLAIAAKQPNLWTHLLFQSAAFTNENFQQVENLMSKWSIYQMVGEKEDSFVSPITNEPLHILSNNRLMSDLLTNRGANVTYIEHNTDHLWDVWRQDLPRALSYFLYN